MNQKRQFSGKKLAATLLVGLLLTGCVAIQPTNGNRADLAAAATPEVAMSEDTILLWEGQPLFAEDENACGRLTIDRYNEVKIGECGQNGGHPQSLGATHEREWLELQTHFAAPTEVGLIGQSLIYRPDGEAFGGAWQRALVAWAQLVHAELASGRISASGATAMSWSVGPSAEQPDLCQQLTVLRYGYAYAATLPCGGGPTRTQVGGWLTDAEMIQFDMWLHQYSELYVDDSYLAGLGERTPSAVEQDKLATWAETVYARLAAHYDTAAQSDSAAWQSYRADSGSGAALCGKYKQCRQPGVDRRGAGDFPIC